jgi:hypothetical protein
MRFRLAAAAIIMVGAWCGFANAQGASCAEDDLKCRVAALEARLSALESQPVPVAALPSGVEIAPAVFSLQRSCKVSCLEEAAAECRKRGFADGEVRNRDRPKTGPTILTRIACKT